MSHALLPMNGEVHGEVHDDQFNNPFTNHIQLSSSTLGIIYSLVARAEVILSHYACCHGNFTEVAQQVLRSIVRETDCRLSYAAGEYMYHYVSEEGVIYLCITDDVFERSKAFLFLEDVRNRFEESYKGTVQNALPFAMNSEFSDVLKETMSHYSTASISMLPSQKLNNIRVRNFELLSDGQLEQLEQLELLQSSDSYSVHSYEATMGLHLRGRLHTCLRDHWKLILVAAMIVFFVVVIMVGVVLGVCFI